MADTVEPTFGDWLKATALYATATNGLAAFYGDEAIEAEIVSPLANKTAALAEAVRQLDFIGGPLAIDEHIVIGRLAGLVGTSAPITCASLGYETGPVCFILGAVENADGTTTLTALRKL